MPSQRLESRTESGNHAVTEVSSPPPRHSLASGGGQSSGVKASGSTGSTPEGDSGVFTANRGGEVTRRSVG